MIWNYRKQNQKRVYLDYASYTPRDEALFSRAKKVCIDGNPSAYHKEGVQMKLLLENARERVSRVIGGHKDEIIFTSGGTESDNLAILGVIQTWKGNGKPHVIVSAIEHSAIIETAIWLEKTGKADVSYLKVDNAGIVDSKALKELLRGETILIAVMYVNNEIGTVQPVEEIAKAIRDFKKNSNLRLTTSDFRGYPLLLVDACQAPKYLPISVEKLHPDLLVLNGSKIYAGAGTGVLFVRRGTPIEATLHGGSQEYGLRPGTENVQAVLDFATAFEFVERERNSETQRLEVLKEYFLTELQKIANMYKVESVLLGDPENSVPGIINIAFPAWQSELLVIELDAKGIAVSSKSACKSDSPDESHVVRALGLELPSESGSVRLSLGRWTTKKDIERAVRALGEIFEKYKNVKK